MKNQKLILKRPKSRNNKDIIKSLEYQRFYHNDRNLFRVLNKTNYMKKSCPYISEEKDLKSVLCKIKNELLFMEEPSIHNLKTENEPTINFQSKDNPIGQNKDIYITLNNLSFNDNEGNKNNKENDLTNKKSNLGDAKKILLLN